MLHPSMMPHEAINPDELAPVDGSLQAVLDEIRSELALREEKHPRRKERLSGLVPGSCFDGRIGGDEWRTRLERLLEHQFSGAACGAGVLCCLRDTHVQLKVSDNIIFPCYCPNLGGVTGSPHGTVEMSDPWS